MAQYAQEDTATNSARNGHQERERLVDPFLIKIFGPYAPQRPPAKKRRTHTSSLATVANPLSTPYALPDSLSNRIQALPQELQDLILEFKVTIAPGKVFIDKHYRSPWQLGVNHRIREKSAVAYYQNTTFGLEEAEGPLWLRSIDRSHRAMIQDVRMVHDSGEFWGGELQENENFYQKHWHYTRFVGEFDWWNSVRDKICSRVIKVRIKVDEEDGSSTEAWVDLRRHYWLFQVDTTFALRKSRELKLYGRRPEEEEEDLYLADLETGQVRRKLKRGTS